MQEQTSVTIGRSERPEAIPDALVALAPVAVRLPTVLRVLSTAHAALFRRTHGKVLGHWFGTQILVLETIGRRSGQLRSTPLVYLPDGQDLVVVAANGGADRHPDWWLNLRSAGCAIAVLGGTRLQVRPRETTGAERDRLWRRLAGHIPVETYQRRTARPLPVIVLSPMSTAVLPTIAQRHPSALTRRGEHPCPTF